jgi:hypothetical protein
MPKASLPLRNLRGVLIVLILAFHSFTAYMVTQPASPSAFDLPPFEWRAFPIVDSNRWIGFDLFCAFQFLYLMQAMFFLSGLFVWQGLQRRGWSIFLAHRIVRLGVPFIIGAYLLMPVAFYPVYLVTGVDPSWTSFWSHWTALPVTATGPIWFLWFLLVLNIGAAALFWLSPRAGRLLTPSLIRDTACSRPSRLFIALVGVSAAAYLPIAADVSSWTSTRIAFGPFEVQATVAPQYVIYFVLGLAVGAHGYNRGLLAADGMLARRWPIWVIGSFAAFLVWIIPSALIVNGSGASFPGLRVVADLGLVIFAAATCFAMSAVFLRFAAKRWPVIDTISEHAFGIYFYHYVFVLWLQFALLGFAIPAILKGLAVLAGALTLSWMASVLTNWILGSSQLLLGPRSHAAASAFDREHRFPESKFPD